ncbi:MAG TPA: DNA-3-methyladenine glycosylase 2 family protein [Alphaproteobacteria bacterium]|nr:DNA-3-methyladenine glycosylase 2 family protein [Alphaproteobacteria bacterium]
MPRHPHHVALKRLAASDPHIAAALTKIGLPPPRSRPPGFGSLARIIVGQQVSVAAAASIWDRLAAGIDPFTPDNVARRTIDELRAFGLSRQKANYISALAADLATGRLDLEVIHALDDAAAIAELMKIKGFGRWSAEVYLLFSLGRPDVFPSGDLGLAVAMQRLKRLRKRPDPKRLIKLSEAWRPHRGAAAFFLWHFLHNAPLGPAK